MSLDSKHEFSFATLLWIAIAISAFILSMMFLSGCKTTEVGAVRKVGKVDLFQPQVLSDYCSKTYPPTVFDSTRIEYREGQAVFVRDTISIDCDTVKGVVTRIVRTPCPPCISRVDTVLIVRQAQTEDKAALKTLTIDRDKAIAAHAKQLQARKIWMWIAIALMAYTVLRWLLKIWVKISLP